MNIARLAGAALAASLIALNAGSATAQQVQPMRYDLAPSGPNAEETIRVTNNRDEPLTIEVLVHRLDVSETGEETLTPAEEDFLIFPPQAIIDADSTQNIRARYIGDPQLAESEAYRINIRQIPIDLSGSGEAGIGVAVSFMTLVNVVPAGAAPQVTPLGVEPTAEGRWRVTLRNDGARYARLNEYLWRFASGGNEIEVRGDQLNERFGEVRTFMEPGQTLQLVLPALEELPGSDITLAFQQLEN